MNLTNFGKACGRRNILLVLTNTARIICGNEIILDTYYWKYGSATFCFYGRINSIALAACNDFSLLFIALRDDDGIAFIRSN